MSARVSAAGRGGKPLERPGRVERAAAVVLAADERVVRVRGSIGSRDSTG